MLFVWLHLSAVNNGFLLYNLLKKNILSSPPIKTIFSWSELATRPHMSHPLTKHIGYVNAKSVLMIFL